jgi:flavorubredoxin
MDIPIRFLPNQELAPDTFLVRQLGGEGLLPELFQMNTMVIRGTEPVIVDTALSINRDEWLEQTFSIVDPADVRWIFLSHDDHDHVGALNQVLEACPRATLVTNWFTVERMSGEGLLPLERLRLVNPGESFTAGDRQLTAIVPPTFDSPTTRGLFDHSTGVYWAADSFANALPVPMDDLDELDAGYWRESFLHLNRLVSPWHQWLDPNRYQAHLDAVHGLGASVAVGAHGLALHDDQIDSAFSLLQELPHLPTAPLMGQADLELMLSLLDMGAEAPAA